MKPTLFSSSSQPLPHQNQISKKSTLVVLYVRQLSIGLLFFISIVMVNAQNIGINPTGTPPHASAGLDVNYTDKGLLLPRVNLTSETDATTIPAPAISLMVYNTNATMGLGFWAWDGTKWVKLLNGNSAWLSTGNTGMIDGTHYIGTTDNVPLNLKVNNQKAGRIDPTGPLFLGYQAGNNNTAYGNTGVGMSALKTNTTGNWNVAVGDSALLSNTTGEQNTAIGSNALNDNIDGLLNTALGNNALYNNIGGDQNTATGAWALFMNTSGTDNTALGLNALYGNTSGNWNTSVGSWSSYNNTSGNYNTVMGVNALYTNSTGFQNTAIGNFALHSNFNGDDNSAIGMNAMYSNTSGNYNTAVGSWSMYSNTSAVHNTAVGNNAMYSNTIGFQNIALGSGTLNHNTNGDDNTASGFNALFWNTTGNYNTALGSWSLFNSSTASQNTAVGNNALYSTTNGFDNTAVGHIALGQNTTGDDNTAIGQNALEANISGNQNTALGAHAFATGTAFSNSTAVGYNSAITASNQIRVGNSSVTSIGGFAAWTNVSDGRFKANVQEDVPGLSFIEKLRPVTYTMDRELLNAHLGISGDLESPADEPLRQTGFIAQEVETAAQQSGYDFSGVDKPKNEEDYYGLRYAEFTVPLVKAIQEQQLQIEAQQILIQQLLERIEALEK
ncbi:MAG: tail fiber domain-containing protein [Saprospiraceae bacterium]|nr:tail fiber domain-containing protein [Saprospiraceae bacterium]